MRLAIVLVLALGGAAAVLACSSSSSSSQPADAGQSCTPGTTFTCDGGAPSPGTCVGDPHAVPPANQLPADQGFAVGCRALFENATCQVETACTCSLSSSSGGAATWSCL